MIEVKEQCQQIDVVLSQGKGSLGNLCMAYMEIICKGQEVNQSRVLRYLAENFDPAESSEQLEIEAIISSNEEKTLEARYERIVIELLTSLVQQNLPEDAFYDELWICINNPLFRDSRGRAIALKTVLEDKRIPYFSIPDERFRMSDDQFRKTRKGMYKRQAKIRYLLSFKFSQKTEQADLLLRELDAVQGDERVVLMALLLKELEKTALNIDLLSKLVGR
ncbi:hypothetical protein [Roseateles sp.]|uniref:hypothetical protein n=1 Tax=Roseateles sp. TaxID=1971397 RepID=UPI003D0E4E96